MILTAKLLNPNPVGQVLSFLSDTATGLEFIPGSDKIPTPFHSGACFEFSTLTSESIPMPSENPYEAPTAQDPASGSANREHLRNVARAQKRVLLAVLAYLAVVGGNIFLQSVLDAGIVILIAAVCVFLFGAVSIDQLAALFHGTGVAVLYVLGMLVPCLGLLLLLLISQKATTLLQENGIKVGLLGANTSSI